MPLLIPPETLISPCEVVDYGFSAASSSSNRRRPKLVEDPIVKAPAPPLHQLNASPRSKRQQQQQQLPQPASVDNHNGHTTLPLTTPPPSYRRSILRLASSSSSVSPPSRAPPQQQQRRRVKGRAFAHDNKATSRTRSSTTTTTTTTSTTTRSSSSSNNNNNKSASRRPKKSVSFAQPYGVEWIEYHDSDNLRFIKDGKAHNNNNNNDNHADHENNHDDDNDNNDGCYFDSDYYNYFDGADTLYTTPAEAEACRAECARIIRHTVKHNTEYVQELIRLFSAGCSSTNSSHSAVDATSSTFSPDDNYLFLVGESPCRGLERKLSSVFGKHRKWTIAGILKMQGTTSRANTTKNNVKDSHNMQECIKYFSKRASQPSVDFARLLAHADRQQANLVYAQDYQNLCRSIHQELYYRDNDNVTHTRSHYYYSMMATSSTTSSSVLESNINEMGCQYWPDSSRSLESTDSIETL